MDLIFPNSDLKITPAKSFQSQEADPKDKNIIGSYQNPETASIWEVFCKDNHYFVRENDDWEFGISSSGPLFYRAVQADLNIQIRFEVNSSERIQEINGAVAGKSFRFIPFLQTSPSQAELEEYIGEYQPNGIHGNTKQTTVPYRSKTSHLKQIIRQGLQNGKPQPPRTPPSPH